MLFPALKPMGIVWIFILPVSSACYCADVKKYELKQVLVITFLYNEMGCRIAAALFYLCQRIYTGGKI